jgi:hypothetical protein
VSRRRRAYLKEVDMAEEPSTSMKLKSALVVAQSSDRNPATGLQVVIAALNSLIPEVEALEQAQPQDAAPSPLDELRRRSDEFHADVQRRVQDFRFGVAQTLEDAARALKGE